jgi:nucleotidyltransferase/DNA polymerase involved in DNA repair
MKESKEREKAIRDLKTLRNIGSVAAVELYCLGIKSSQQLKHSNPEELYERLKKKKGGKLDRCVLYQFRGAIHDIPWPECKDQVR